MLLKISFGVVECVESSQHHLFQYRFAHYIWLSCYQWFRDTSVLASSCIPHFWQYNGRIKGHKTKSIWWGVLASIVHVEYMATPKWYWV
ncbi:hypothetical protein HKD37_05G013164 [Glycine soja]